MPNAKKKPKKKPAKKTKKVKAKKPSQSGDSGQDRKTGRFLPGNKVGKGGNPHAAKIQHMRKAFYDAVTEQDMRDICKALIKKAKKGDVHAAKEVLFRVLGQYPEVVIPNEPDQEDWIYRTTLSDGSYLVVPQGTDPIDAHHAAIRVEKSKEP